MRGYRALGPDDRRASRRLLVIAGHPPGAGAAADRDCSDFESQAAAQHYFDANGGSATYAFDSLDGDGDGRACESLPCP